MTSIAAIIAMAGKLYGAGRSIYGAAKRIPKSIESFYTKRQNEQEKAAKLKLQEKQKEEKKQAALAKQNAKLQVAALKQKEAQQKANAQKFKKDIKQDSSGVMQKLFPYNSQVQKPINPQPVKPNDLKVPNNTAKNVIKKQNFQRQQNIQKVQNDFNSGKMFPTKNPSWNEGVKPKPISPNRVEPTNKYAKGLNKSLAQQDKIKKQSMNNPVSMDNKIKNIMDGNA